MFFNTGCNLVHIFLFATHTALYIYFRYGTCHREGYLFPDIGIKNGINFYNFGIRNGTDFQDFGMKYKVGYTL